MGPNARLRMLRDPRLEKYFPNLAGTGYEITSPEDAGYNCIAWAAGDSSSWWEPDPMNVSYWPAEAPREISTEAFIDAFKVLGFSPCDSADEQDGIEKLALFVNSSGEPTHMARQLPNGKWSSKLGKSYDIEHAFNGLAGSAYGTIVVLLARAC